MLAVTVAAALYLEVRGYLMRSEAMLATALLIAVGVVVGMEAVTQ